ncbi:YbjN domain-containing protein [Qipengyuania aquimaris]|uniref:YbjN domain-containing protein n=1 Tax=Qipengyuania aquimaris TaxID=255984 RepID=UPI001FCFBAFF|nr:YbjN domain-containing protein [Qipengyuania aquimaris]UOR14769.1 YbjN domain-containing protein [Qipengyuania aquimaris]
MFKYAITGAIGAAAFLAATPLAAKNITADLDQIAGLLKEEGYQAKIDESEGQRWIESGMSGYTYLILPFGCNDAGEDCKSVQFYVSFVPQTKPTLEEMNTYAAENRFGRVYLDNDGDPVIEMDIDLEAGGMSKELFIDNLAYWDAIMVAFGDFAFSKDPE